MKKIVLFGAVAVAVAAAAMATGFAVDGSAGGSAAIPEVAELSAEAREVTVYKSPTCGCCTLWAEHLSEAGFEVRVEDRVEMIPVKQELGVPLELGSCHTAVVGGYVLEGHVPAEDVARLLSERPDVVGLAVPGMPMGSPGMEGPRRDAYSVIAFDGEGGQRVFARH